MRRVLQLAWLILAVAIVGFLRSHSHSASHRQISGPIRHEAYVWQRRWTPPVREAIVAAQTGTSLKLCGLTALAGEIRFRGDEVDVVRVPLDMSLLSEGGRRPISLALRVGQYSGPFAHDQVLRQINSTAAAIVGEAHRQLIDVRELQLDFDCASSKLNGYCFWLREIQHAVSPTPVVITALPTWLKHQEFSELAHTAGAFILQVHSLAAPAGPDARWSLCDTDQAREAVERAARLGVPFRVALPTYSYEVAFDAAGQIRALVAEATSQAWPEGTVLREVAADPDAMAGLVRSWSQDRPPEMQGIIWYRLPTNDDSLNWSAVTLASVMRGQSPTAQPQVSVEHAESSLYELRLRNAGSADMKGRIDVQCIWRHGRLVAADGLSGFTLLPASTSTLVCECEGNPHFRLKPGDSQVIAWLRLDQDTEVEAHVVPAARGS